MPFGKCTRALSSTYETLVNRISSPHRSLIPGLIASSIVDSRNNLEAWVREEIETVVGEKRVASVRDEIEALATAIITLRISYAAAMADLSEACDRLERGVARLK